MTDALRLIAAFLAGSALVGAVHFTKTDRDEDTWKAAVCFLVAMYLTLWANS